MYKSKFFKNLLVLSVLVVVLVLTSCQRRDEKIGVLFVGAGEAEKYGVRWLDGYFDHLFIFMPPGFFAGRTGWEGESCYTHIHFASAIEAEICNAAIYDGAQVIAEGDPIDAWCEAYPEYEGFGSDPEIPIVHGIFRHSKAVGDDTFRENCFDDGGDADPIAMYGLLESETENPYNTHPSGFDHLGPHVDDPDGAGIGVADFVEVASFGNMLTYYYTFNALDYKDPYGSQAKEWYYGAKGTTNIRDVLDAAVLADPEINDGTEIVCRHASEAFVANKDERGNPAYYAESMETAIDELINDEAVDRIVVFGLASGYTNLINYGPFWRDKEGHGISALPGKTYYECIQDIEDGCGPDTEAERDQLIADKPWDMYKTIVREVSEVIAGRVPVTCTLEYGSSDFYDQAVLEMLNYTVDKYGISDDGTSLKVVLTTHGYTGGYMNGAECDVYFRNAPETTARVINTIVDNFSWSGKFKVVHAPVEYSQPSGEGGTVDQASPEKPFGEVIGAGEQIDMAIKGKYVSELGEVVDNGIVDSATNEVFDYVILIPNTFDAESSDTLGHMRRDTLGNHEMGSARGSDAWIRQEEDQNGIIFGDPAAKGTEYYPYHDNENFTVRVMDASGWCSEAADETTVCKGDPDNPTTVILSGTILSYPDGKARERLTDAAVEVIKEAIKDPGIGGYSDEPPAPTNKPSDRAN